MNPPETLDLSELEWRLTGWHPYYWKNAVTVETGIPLDPDVGPIPARVPGSVQQALQTAGILPDWNVRRNSRQCEWVEHRHWVFETVIPAEVTAGWSGGRARLQCDGLDYRGLVLLNGSEIGRFQNSFIPHAWNIGEKLLPGQPNRLALVFTGHPDFLGQIGWTSRITEWKVRFHYGWDWCPRLVQIGIWDGIRISLDRGDLIEDFSFYPECRALTEQEGRGAIVADLTVRTRTAKTLELTVTDPEGAVVLESRRPAPGTGSLRLQTPDFPVRLWRPNGLGAQPLYTVCASLLDQTGALIQRIERSTGFRQVEWQPCEGAPAGAEPWLCRVNGEPVFLQGFNWVPIRPFFADVREEHYRALLETYRDLGTNLLRVWGGGPLEKECFYRLCDQFGIMVWQELPLSSSGIDNWPPETPDAIRDMRAIAVSYARRRRRHPSLILWCGGNELQGGLDGSKQGMGKPVDRSHPLLAAQAETLARIDPTRRFVPTSPSGPRFTAAADEFGRGLHHDVHGPWNHAGPLDAAWRDYWRGDDALFRSEVGMPGSSPADILRRFGGDAAWPADKQANPWYRHCGGWWDQWRDFRAACGNSAGLEEFVEWSQNRQAAALEYIARACKQRFPRIGGVLFWMGHDCFPCPVNTAVIDFLGRPKPAARAIAEVFRSPPGAPGASAPPSGTRPNRACQPGIERA